MKRLLVLALALALLPATGWAVSRVNGWTIGSSFNTGGDSTWVVDSVVAYVCKYVATGDGYQWVRSQKMKPDTMPATFHSGTVPVAAKNYNYHGRIVPSDFNAAGGGYGPAIKVCWHVQAGGTVPMETWDPNPSLNLFPLLVDTINATPAIDVTSIATSTAAASALADAFDGNATSSATMYLRKMKVNNTTEGDTALVVSNTSNPSNKPAAVIQQTYNGPGLLVQGGTNLGQGMTVTSRGANSEGLYVNGTGGGPGALIQSGTSSSGSALVVQNMSLSGNALALNATGTGQALYAPGLYTKIMDSVWLASFSTILARDVTVGSMIDSAKVWSATSASTLTADQVRQTVSNLLYGVGTVTTPTSANRVYADVQAMGTGVLTSSAIANGAFIQNKFDAYALSFDKFGTDFYQGIATATWGADTATRNNTVGTYGEALAKTSYVQGASDPATILNYPMDGVDIIPAANNLAGRIDQKISAVAGATNFGSEPWRVHVVDTTGGVNTLVNGAKVSVWNNGLSSMYGIGYTGTSGYVYFAADSASGTNSYRVSASLPGLLFSDSAYYTMSKSLGAEVDTIFCYRMSISVPTGSDSCNVLIFTNDPNAVAYATSKEANFQDTSGVALSPTVPAAPAGLDGTIQLRLPRTAATRQGSKWQIEVRDGYDRQMLKVDDYEVPNQVLDTLLVSEE
jgi:hypothetical protein